MVAMESTQAAATVALGLVVFTDAAVEARVEGAQAVVAEAAAHKQRIKVDDGTVWKAILRARWIADRRAKVGLHD